MNRNKNERTCRLGLRVSPKEKEQIDGIARSCGISTAEYLRKRALGYAVKAAPPDAFYHFIRQMSRLLNKVPSAKVEEEALKLFDEVRAVFAEGPKQSKREITEEMEQWLAQDFGPSNLA